METVKKLISIVLGAFFICLFISAILAMALAKMA